MRYFDTGFLVPLILPEVTGRSVAGFFEDLPADDLAVSDWTRVEFPGARGGRGSRPWRRG